MKKIKITEDQAKKLGLLKELEDDGLKSSGNAMGDLIVRVVISGQELVRFKDTAIKLILRQDPTATVQFYPTGNIVGNIKDIKRQSIERDLKSLDPTIKVEKKVPTPPKLKEGVRNIVKLTKEQYNRIFASGLINESDDVKGGLTRVDTNAKKQFAAGDVKNLKPVSEEEGINADSGSKFDIKKPNTQIPSSAQGKFGQPIKENESSDKLKKETIELIRYLYRKSEDLSPFWEEHGISYDEICSALLHKKLIVKKGGKYELSKALGEPQAAIQAVENELRGIFGDKESEAVLGLAEDDYPATDAPKTDAPMTDAPVDEYDNHNYPAGADADRNAPWHQNDPAEPSKQAKNPKLEPVAFNRELTIFKDPQGQLYAFYQDSVDKQELYPYASVERHYAGKDEDGEPQYDYDFDNVEIDGDVVANYVNDNLASLSKGEGLEDWESGVDLVKLDDALRQDLLSVYDKDKNLFKALGGVDESLSQDDAMRGFKDNLKAAFTPKEPTGEDPAAKQSRIVAKLHDLKNKELERQAREKAELKARYDSAEGVDEMTSAASSGAFTAPMSGAGVVKREMPNVPVVGETTSGSGSMGAYDANALPGIGRNGEFKDTKKSKAETTPQWAGGSFVKQPACSKMNNNKSAQNGGCNQGAGSLKTVKASGSINAPSLGENEIFEAIAKKTGKTIEEVRQIINTKKSKA
jgi:hypothetical protein